MSRRLPTSTLSRSDSSSMVARNSWRAAGLQSTSSCSRLVTEALIDASGVRRSWETARRMAVRSWSPSALASASAASASSRPRSSAEPSWVANACRTCWSSAVSAGPECTSTAPLHQRQRRHRPRGRSAPARRRRPRRSSPRRRGTSRATAVRSKVARTWSTMAATGSSSPTSAAGHPGQGLGLGTGRCAASAERRDTWVDQRAHQRGHHQEVSRATMFSPSAMVKVWKGWREEPVHRQRAHHRGHQRRSEAADHGHHHHEHQVQQHVGRQVERRPAPGPGRA